MKLLARLSSFYYLRSIDRNLKRLADAAERAHPKPTQVDPDQQVVIDEYEADVKTESDDLDDENA